MTKYVCIIDKPKWLSEEEFRQKAMGSSFSLYFDEVINRLSCNMPKRKAKNIVLKRREAILKAFPDIELYRGSTIERACFDINAENKEEAIRKLNSLTERLESFFKEYGIKQKMVLNYTKGLIE